jgi:nicotinamide mononucleotide transporter
MSDWWSIIAEQASYLRWQEWLSTITQVMSVWYARKNNILVYPTGIIGVILAAYVYLWISTPPLYADGILNIYYLAMSIYGWIAWSQKNDDQSITHPISWLTRLEIKLSILTFALGWGLMFFTLKTYTDSDVPLLDSLVSATALVAMWWMARRKVENWIAWIISNLIAIPLNAYKGFYLFSLMYALFLVLAMMGYKEWKRKIA